MAWISTLTEYTRAPVAGTPFTRDQFDDVQIYVSLPIGDGELDVKFTSAAEVRAWAEAFQLAAARLEAAQAITDNAAVVAEIAKQAEREPLISDATLAEIDRARVQAAREENADVL